MTKWARDVKPSKVLPEYPRPQMVREDWQNLNGRWDYALTAKDATNARVVETRGQGRAGGAPENHRDEY